MSGSKSISKRRTVRFVPPEDPRDRARMVERFIEKLSVRPGCWEYTGSRNQDGYGFFGVGPSVSKGAHIVAYELFVGPVPNGQFVCHACDNPPCCRPTHLFCGTNKENMGDAVSKGRFLGRSQGENHPMHKLSEKEVLQIRSLYDAGVRGVEIARQFQVTPTQISAIGKRKSWRYLE